jgi:hypothetical protein
MQTTGDLFATLSSISGWGPKTAALFLRNLALIQLTSDLREKFWTDLDDLDMQAIRLPVDKVIHAIFSKLIVSKDPTYRLNGFDKINE